MNSQNRDIVASGEVNMDELSKKEKRALYYRTNELRSKKYYEDNKESIRLKNKKYHEDNKESIRLKKKERYIKNKTEIIEKCRDYRENNKEKRLLYRKNNKVKIAIRAKIWSDENKEKIKIGRDKYLKRCRDRIVSVNRTYWRKHYKDDIQFKLGCVIRNRIKGHLKRHLKGKKRVSSALEELGCTLEELKLHLESQFQPDMTWDNHGLYGWHIDHIKPLASFDLTDIEQFKQACHYSNLQPLWAFDNLSKGAKIIDKSQSLEHTANTNQSPQTEDIGITYIQAPKDPNGVEKNDC
jgi:hypothetical protein